MTELYDLCMIKLSVKQLFAKQNGRTARMGEGVEFHQAV